MKSPYLSQPERLADVIAAIQVMGTYRSYKLNFENWADRINGDGGLADHWEKVFQEHPEFFRLDRGRTEASLVWRRQFPKLFDLSSRTEISTKEFRDLQDQYKEDISRRPLSDSEIKTLIDTATNLHSRAVEADKHEQWGKRLALQAAAGLLGALVGSWASVHFAPTAPMAPASGIGTSSPPAVAQVK